MPLFFPPTQIIKSKKKKCKWTENKTLILKVVTHYSMTVV